ncbi:hypothetical protein Tco_0761879 [Tanacetum coccineum]
MEDTVDIDVQDSPSPRWENILQSPILENVSSKYKLKLKYGDIYQPQGDDDDSDGCPSEGSYHSYIGSDNEDEIMNYERETISDNKNIPTIEVISRFSNAALNHYALMTEFGLVLSLEKSEPTRFQQGDGPIICRWRIHAAILQDGVTFKVKKLSESHSCIRSNKGGNKCATQGWIASVIKDKLKSDGDVSVTKLKKWLMKHYNVEVPYLRVFRGKEQAYTDMYGKWEDSFIMINAFKEEIRNKNPGSVVDTDFDSVVFNGTVVDVFIRGIVCLKQLWETLMRFVLKMKEVVPCLIRLVPEFSTILFPRLVLWRLRWRVTLLHGHIPRLLNMSNGPVSSVGRFCPCLIGIYQLWFTREGFDDMVAQAWNSFSHSDSNKLIRFKKKLQALKAIIRGWIKDQHTSLTVSKHNIMEELATIDKTLDSGTVSDEILLKRMELTCNLNAIKLSESKDFTQKAKVKWAIEGDENSKFFHGLVNRKRA